MEMPETFDFCIAKDVFEHISVGQLPSMLRGINAKVLFAIIPLGDKGVFRAPANNFDVTHVTCASEDWWKDLFECNGWEVQEFTFRVDGIKDSYYQYYPKAHGFFTCTKKI